MRDEIAGEGSLRLEAGFAGKAPRRRRSWIFPRRRRLLSQPSARANSSAMSVTLQQLLHRPFVVVDQGTVRVDRERSLRVGACHHEERLLLVPVRSRHGAFKHGGSASRREREYITWLGNSGHLDPPRKPDRRVVDPVVGLALGANRQRGDPHVDFDFSRHLTRYSGLTFSARGPLGP